MTPERYQRVGDLYHEALALPGQDRSAFLDRACVGDPELRRDVESLLSAHEESEHFMETPAAAIAAELLNGGRATTLTSIGRYQVLSLLGRGGMGEVYLAQDVTLGRKVAIKVVRPPLTANPQALLRFEQEARAASSLNHPNIVTVHEIGEFEQGRFIAMEYVEGQPLSSMTGQPMPIDTLLPIARQLAQALAVAHAALIIHRDIKPENIMVRPDGYVKVLDFGVARLVSQQTVHRAGLTSVTHPGLLIGTPRYMSPEQIRGEQATTASDIFALGAVLYELVTGRHPADGYSMLGPHPAIGSGAPPSPVQYVPDIPAPLCQLIVRMLENHPAGRPAAQDVVAQLSSLTFEMTPPRLPSKPRRPAGAEGSRTLIGAYEVIAPLSAGNMGKVYRAWDPRFGREVAVKILAEKVAGDENRRRRFLDEARATGSLSHPNIVTVYDVRLEDDTPYIVSELVVGKQLRDEIDRAPIKLARMIDLVAQIASGLSAAHQAGIAHRDLKPENIMITRDGRIKILDFGLAKATNETGEDIEPLDAGTVTAPGVIVGTPNYMSPEQASGGRADFRSDQFSLGVILYEMLTGVHPFRRDSAVQTMSAIVGDEPRPVRELNANAPTPLRWIIDRCLAKNPADRYNSTGDLAKDLITLQRRLTETGEVNVSGARVVRTSLIAISGAAAVAILMLVAAAVVPLPSSGLPLLKLTPLVTDAPFQGFPAWSPDGTTLAYASSVKGDVLQIFSKSVATASSQQITDCRFDCSDPFWSPDGTRIYYHSLARESESLFSVSSAGGPSEVVVENALRATISRDGALAFFREHDDPRSPVGLRRELWLASSNGVDARRYPSAPFATRTFVDGALRFSPDGSKLLAWVWGWADDGSTIPSPEFWIVPLPVGQPYRVLHALGQAAPTAPSFDWLPNGRQIILSLWDESTTSMHLWVADLATGTRTPVVFSTHGENRPAVAPNGNIAFTDEAVDFDLIEIPLDGGPPRGLLTTSRNELDAAFTQDGSQYAYISDKDGALEIWYRDREGRLFDRPVVHRNHFPDDPTLALGSLALSPKGDRIAFQRYAERTGYQIWISTVSAAGQPVPLATASFYQDAPSWSPDGEWIAFVQRTKDYRSSVARIRVGTAQPPEIILPQAATLYSRPKWSPGGRWIACDTSDGLVIVNPATKETKTITEELWLAFTWDQDERYLYALHEADRPRHYALTRVNVETLEEKVINPDLGVIPPAYQPIRGLSLVGGRTLVTSVASAESDIWLAEGLDLRPRTLLSLLWRGN